MIQKSLTATLSGQPMGVAKCAIILKSKNNRYFSHEHDHNLMSDIGAMLFFPYSFKSSQT
jgi:hypothetical protein